MLVDEPEPWGTEVVTATVLGHPCRVFAQRPRRLDELLTWGARHDNAVHLVEGGRRVAFTDLIAAAAYVRSRLRDLGLQPGDRVLLSGGNSLNWVITFWACLMDEWVLVPANAWWSAEEVAHAARLVGPRLAVVDERRADRMPPGLPRLRLETILHPTEDPDILLAPAAASAREQAHELSEDDPAIILFTSGTTSFPRGATLTHRSLLANLQNLLAVAGRLPGNEASTRSPGVTLMTMPLFHIGGIQQLFTALVSGGRLVFLEGRFSAERVLQLIADEQITGWAAVPTMLSRVLDVLEDPSSGGHDTSSLRTLVIGGSTVAESLRDRARRAFPRAATKGLGASYGLTEISGVAATAAGSAVTARPNTVGRPLPTVEIRIDEPDETGCGEILVRSPGTMLGYWGEPDAQILGAERWLHTGDLGTLDDDGFLYVLGRSKDVVIRGGENISAAQVEDRLLQHPAVNEVAVLGLPHPDLGEELAAAVVVTPGASVDPDELSRFAGDQLAYFAVPSAWRFERELPKNATGKILKHQLAASWPVARATTSRPVA